MRFRRLSYVLSKLDLRAINIHPQGETSISAGLRRIRRTGPTGYPSVWRATSFGYMNCIQCGVSWFQ